MAYHFGDRIADVRPLTNSLKLVELGYLRHALRIRHAGLEESIVKLQPTGVGREIVSECRVVQHGFVGAGSVDIGVDVAERPCPGEVERARLVGSWPAYLTRSPSTFAFASLVLW